MRILTINLLAVALLLFGAASASAYSIDLFARVGPSDTLTKTLSSLTSTDTVIVDVFWSSTSEPFVNAISIAVLVDSPGLTYDAVASEALPVIYPNSNFYGGTTGSGPSYILYSPAAGTDPGGIFFRQQTPWQTFPNPDPKTQVNLNFPNNNITAFADASASNLWIGSLVFHVEPGYAGGVIELCTTCGGNVIGTSGAGDGGLTATLGAPITLATNVPEPTTAALIGLGVLGLAIAGRRK